MLQRHEKDPLFVSPLCQRVSPFKTLQALYTSVLCQRVSLFSKIYSIDILFLQFLGSLKLESVAKAGTLYDSIVQ